MLHAICDGSGEEFSKTRQYLKRYWSLIIACLIRFCDACADRFYNFYTCYPVEKSVCH
jgi:hypothetical protein